MDRSAVENFLADARERAQGLVEYAIIVAVVAVVAIVAVQAFGNGIVLLFGRLLAHFTPLG